jgi:hypothetical protein
MFCARPQTANLVGASPRWAGIADHEFQDLPGILVDG